MRSVELEENLYESYCRMMRNFKFGFNNNSLAMKLCRHIKSQTQFDKFHALNVRKCF